MALPSPPCPHSLVYSLSHAWMPKLFSFRLDMVQSLSGQDRTQADGSICRSVRQEMAEAPSHPRQVTAPSFEHCFAPLAKDDWPGSVLAVFAYEFGMEGVPHIPYDRDDRKRNVKILIAHIGEVPPVKKAYQGLPVFTLARNFLQPRYAVEMVRKIGLRLAERNVRNTRTEAETWCDKVGIDLANYCSSRDRDLWDESNEVSDKLAQKAVAKLASFDVDFGGFGGAASYPLLYFLVRRQRPRVVVETGVAAGFSSYALLTALKKNGAGKLYSSDFPYFRLDDPEKYIGCVVDDVLKEDWICLTEGDRANLPRILSVVDEIDLFHYDSDKTYSGRKWAMDAVLPKMAKGATVVMDDINDNLFFRDFIAEKGIKATVFKFHAKYVGMFTVP